MSMADNLEKMLAAGQDSAMLRFGPGSAYFSGEFPGSHSAPARLY